MGRADMLAKITSKNQLTLPKKITNEIGPAEYFDIEVKSGQIHTIDIKRNSDQE
jgi:hypothetical protein